MSKPPSPLSLTAKAEIYRLLDGDPTPQTLDHTLRYLAGWRAKLLANTVTAEAGHQVQSGPFAGMHYKQHETNTAFVPRLLGTYESALHPIIEDIIAKEPSLIIDVGASEGYYATGFALRLPNAIIWARNGHETAQEAAQTLAETNHVAGRVKTGGKLTHADFDICRAQHTIVLCDIAGQENALLDPDQAKGLRRADILVEVHEAMTPGLTETLTARFAATHEITQITGDFDSRQLPDWMAGLSDLDRHIALWEGRAGVTAWLWMQSTFH